MWNKLSHGHIGVKKNEHFVVFGFKNELVFYWAQYGGQPVSSLPEN